MQLRVPWDGRTHAQSWINKGHGINVVHHFIGAAGPEGARGEKGEQGDQGPKKLASYVLALTTFMHNPI